MNAATVWPVRRSIATVKRPRGKQPPAPCVAQLEPNPPTPWYVTFRLKGLDPAPLGTSIEGEAAAGSVQIRMPPVTCLILSIMPTVLVNLVIRCL